jgi:hypothetical protein
MSLDLSMAITLLKRLKELLKNFIENMFVSWKDMAQKVCNENGIPPEYKQTRVSKWKQLHDYEGEDSGTSAPRPPKLYQNYFLCILDQGIL